MGLGFGLLAQDDEDTCIARVRCVAARQRAQYADWSALAPFAPNPRGDLA
jgi:hypothetical protein